MNLLRIKNFNLEIGSSVIEDLSFNIDEKQSVALVGNSGSGKSTICKNVVSRTLVLGEAEIFEMPPKSQRIGFLPQDGSSYDWLNVKGYLKLFARDDNEIQEIVSLLPRVYLKESILYTPMISLSGGEKKRVGLLLSLISSDRLVVLDEALTGMDVHLKLRCYELIEEYKNSRNKGLLIISHDIEEIFKLSDIAIYINDSTEKFILEPNQNTRTKESKLYADFETWLLGVLNDDSKRRMNN